MTEQERQRRRAYYERNREAIKTKAAAWARAHPERRKATNRAHYQRHREAQMERQRQWRQANPEKVREQHRRHRGRQRETHLRRTFGLTGDEYAARLAAQGGVCAICARPETRKDKAGHIKPLAVDHCHESGAVRGLLCDACNQGIGHFGDDVTRMRQAMAYLERV